MLVLTNQHREGIFLAAKAGWPNEICGILAGTNNRVEKVFAMRNTSDTPKLCYLMDPKEQLKISKEIRAAGWEMLGIYHSHAESEAYPSARDVELAYYPDTLYFIVSLKDKANPGLRAFRIVEGTITEEVIKYDAPS